MMRSATFLLAFTLVAVAQAEESYLGLYLQGQKIGYVSYNAAPTKLGKVAVTRSDSRTFMDMGLLGTPLQMTVDSSTWTNASGKPLRMTFKQSSGGRVQTMDAQFLGKSVALVIDNNGQKTKKTLPMPNGPVVDDPVTLVRGSGVKTQTFYILDPTTGTFIKNTVRLLGPATADLKGRKVNATLAEVIDPRATTKIYVDDKGGFVKAEAPMGIEMLPEPKAIAMKKTPGFTPNVDLAARTSLVPTPAIEDPRNLTELKLKFTGPDLSRLPSDEHQTVTKDGEQWVVEVHPPQRLAKTSIFQARKDKPEWVKPGLNIPSSDPKFINLARKIVGNKSTVIDAADAIQAWVYAEMTPNAGIGVLRDAGEVLKTKEGVCRDYAVLTASLLRAAGIPTRVASGLVTWDGTFYYHAWCEVWDGAHWVGVDSTTEDRQLAANHVKLADGDVESAFTFTFLDRAKVEVLSQKHKD